MFVLVAMQDDGLLILPTHRLIGGLDSFDVNIFKAELGNNGVVADTPFWPSQIDQFMEQTLAKSPPNSFGLLDGKTKKIYLVTITNLDVMKTRRAGQERRLAKAGRGDPPELSAGSRSSSRNSPAAKRSTRATPPTRTKRRRRRMASNTRSRFLLRSTPLHALEELGKTKEVMPQKSTFFYPKLATGMVMNPIR